jgi:hypothetical protein
VDQASVVAILGAIFHNLASSGPLVVPVIYTLLAASLIDLLTGVWASWASRTFKWPFIGEYVRSHIALKVGPILLALFAGIAVGGTDSAAGIAGIATAATSAGLYLAATVSSAVGNIAQGQSKTKGLPSGVPAPTTASTIPTPVELLPPTRTGK